MRTGTIRISKTLGLLVVGLASLAIPAGAQEPLRDHELVAAVRNGGHVFYFRHTETDHDQTDAAVVDYADCSTQRNLSPAGREQALATGEAFRALGIPVSRVVTSPYCRCVDTANLAFGHAEVSQDLAFSIRTTQVEARRLGRELRAMLATAPAEGTNTVLVAHTANLKEAAHIWPKPEGIVLVFKPVAGNNFAYIGTIKPREWAGLIAESVPASRSGE